MIIIEAAPHILDEPAQGLKAMSPRYEGKPKRQKVPLLTHNTQHTSLIDPSSVTSATTEEPRNSRSY
jgi:hypothetical protein